MEKFTAASRRLRLRQMADEGDTRADRVLLMQDQPGEYFTVVQIGLNAVAILGGVVGEGRSPYFNALFALWRREVGPDAGLCRLLPAVTSLFILFADLLPKRLGMAHPLVVALRGAPMQWLHGAVQTHGLAVQPLRRCPVAPDGPVHEA